MKLRLDHATRFTIDGNTTGSGDRRYDPRLRVHIERLGLDGDAWYITSLGMVYNHRTGGWDDDWTFRHTGKDPYLTGRETAWQRAHELADARTD